jgi:putative oxidoreductase
MPTMTDRLSRFRRLVLRVAARLRWIAPTLSRLTLGWVFLQSGWGKLHNLEKVIGFFTELGIPARRSRRPSPRSWSSRAAADAARPRDARSRACRLIAIMIVAIGTAKRATSTSCPICSGCRSTSTSCLALWLGGYGAGPLSLDYLIARLDAARGGRRSEGHLICHPDRAQREDPLGAVRRSTAPAERGPSSLRFSG